MRLLYFLAGLAAGVMLAQDKAQAQAMGRRMGQRAGTGDTDDLRTAAGAGGAGGPSTGGERGYPTHAQPQSDGELRDRIRARMARTIGNPEAIQVEVSGGCVTLRGQVQARDLTLLMTEVENTAGVQEVRNQLEVRDAPVAGGQQPSGRVGEEATSRMS